LTPRVPPFKVTQGHRNRVTDTYRSTTYDFLLTFNSNHGSISYRFEQFSPPSCILRRPPPPEGVLLAIGYRHLGLKKNRNNGAEKNLTIALAIWIHYTNVTDGQLVPRLRIALCGKIAWQASTIIKVKLNINKLVSFIKHVRPMTPIKPQISFC